MATFSALNDLQIDDLIDGTKTVLIVSLSYEMAVYISYRIGTEGMEDIDGSPFEDLSNCNISSDFGNLIVGLVYSEDGIPSIA
ncbi:hypothetical protein B9Z55_025326 [Caenorhabditis nigoni]|uniref:Uncharacterized protein n=1 Tax=Caenorhabditis nigoni TaxID=1611254 RepID=A0A2G5SY57_9PELO|nr:hypothetical protein B9Z55_025326 [Caenorhabditis nigoni]